MKQNYFSKLALVTLLIGAVSAPAFGEFQRSGNSQPINRASEIRHQESAGHGQSNQLFKSSNNYWQNNNNNRGNNNNWQGNNNNWQRNNNNWQGNNNNWQGNNNNWQGNNNNWQGNNNNWQGNNNSNCQTPGGRYWAPSPANDYGYQYGQAGYQGYYPSNTGYYQPVQPGFMPTGISGPSQVYGYGYGTSGYGTTGYGYGTTTGYFPPTPITAGIQGGTTGFLPTGVPNTNYYGGAEIQNQIGAFQPTQVVEGVGSITGFQY